jgi:hypothetical protein
MIVSGTFSAKSFEAAAEDLIMSFGQVSSGRSYPSPADTRFTVACPPIAVAGWIGATKVVDEQFRMSNRPESWEAASLKAYEAEFTMSEILARCDRVSIFLCATSIWTGIWLSTILHLFLSDFCLRLAQFVFRVGKSNQNKWTN